MGEGGGVDIHTLASLLRAHRLPLHVDFYADPIWPKRAAQLTHIPAQLLLFVRPTQADALIAEVSGAAERFERGAVIVFSFKVRALHHQPRAAGVVWSPAVPFSTPLRLARPSTGHGH